MRLQAKYYEKIAKEILNYLRLVIWNDISVIFQQSNIKSNARITPSLVIIKALENGKITYVDGVFKGTSNLRLTKALQTFATYNKYTRTWEGTPPADVTTAITNIKIRNRLLNERIQQAIDDIPRRVDDTIENLEFSIRPAIIAANEETAKSLHSVGISADENLVPSKEQIEQYRQSMGVYIKSFTEEQTTALTDMIRENVLSGYNRKSLINKIKTLYGVSEAKATFLARQETTLFVSALRNERYTDAGIKVARWSSSSDARVVGTPGGKYPNPTIDHGNHYNMNGKFIKLDDPTVYAKTREDAHYIITGIYTQRQL